MLFCNTFRKARIRGFSRGCIEVNQIGDLDFLDTVSRRYANPEGTLNATIRDGRFSEFVRKTQEWENDRFLWDLYLHKYTGKESFEDWKRGIIRRNVDAALAKLTVGATIRNSLDILENFDPSRG